MSFHQTVYRHYAEHLRREGLTLEQSESVGPEDKRVLSALGGLYLDSSNVLSGEMLCDLLGIRYTTSIIDRARSAFFKSQKIKSSK